MLMTPPDALPNSADAEPRRISIRSAAPSSVPRSGRVGPDADDAARRVAEQRRRRAAQDLDPIGGAELQVGELTLTVGKRLRDPVHQHLDPAHRKGRPGPKPADRDPLIQREVVAVRRVHPWDGHERLVQAPRGAGPADLGLVHELDGLGDAVDGRVGSGDRDDGGGQRVDLEAVVVTGGCVPLLGRRRERPEGTEQGEGRHSHQSRWLSRRGEGFLTAPPGHVKATSAGETSDSSGSAAGRWRRSSR